MPRYYCDYCDTYLTHDSPSVRKQHNAGYKHKANVRAYYQQFEEQQTQSLIDQKVKEHLGQTAAVFHQQVGAAIHQHYALGYKHSVPVLPPPSLPVPGGPPGSSQPPLLPTIRPPVLPPPTGNPGGYGPPPTFRPPVAALPTSGGMAQANGIGRPPTLSPPGAPGVRSLASTPSSVNGLLAGQPAGPPGGPSTGPPGAYQQMPQPQPPPQQQQQPQPPPQQRPPGPPAATGYGYNYGPPASSGGYGQQRQGAPGPPGGPPPGAPPAGPPSAPPSGQSGNYNSPQQPRGPPAGVPVQNSYNYSQPPGALPRPAQTASNSYGPSPPGAPGSFRT